jgi:hypothetical protein
LKVSPFAPENKLLHQGLNHGCFPISFVECFDPAFNKTSELSGNRNVFVCAIPVSVGLSIVKKQEIGEVSTTKAAATLKKVSV